MTAVPEKRVVRLPAALHPQGRNRLVRIGSALDGGYIIAASLLGCTDDVLSFGLGYNWDFERDMLRLTAARRIDCYDHTIGPGARFRRAIGSALKWPLNPARYGSRLRQSLAYRGFFEGNPRLRHFEMAIGADDGARASTLATALKRLDPPGDATFLKCDIEGGEYAIAAELADNAHRFNGIALEIHDFGRRPEEALALVAALGRSHAVDHVHVNNLSKVDERGLPSVIEVSLSRRDIEPEADVDRLDRLGLPHAIDGEDLDRPNVPDRPDFRIVHV